MTANESTAPAAAPEKAREIHRRRRWVCDEPMQKRIVLRLMALVFVIGLIAGYLSIHIMVALKGEEMNMIEALRASLPWVVFATVAIAFVGVLVGGVILSHYVAGPAYHIRRAIDRVAAGETGVRVHLRRHDHLHEMAQSANTLFEEIDALRRDAASPGDGERD